MKKIFIALLMSSALIMTSCKDFLNMPPKNAKVIYTMSDVREAMSTLLFATANSSYYPGWSNKAVRFNGQYIQYPFTRYINVTTSLLTNDLDMEQFPNETLPVPADGGRTFSKDYHENKDWMSYTTGSRIWAQVFSNIGFVNNILDDLKKVPDYNKTDYERISGEGRVMRAYYLFRLNQLFAPYDKNEFGIPYNLDADVIEGGERSKQTDFYTEIIKEITDVQAYATVPKASWNLFFNHDIMNAILAEIYWYKAESCAKEAGDWAKAESYARLARNGNDIENTIDQQKELTIIPDNATFDRPHRFALVRIALNYIGPRDNSPWGNVKDGIYQSPSDELYSMYDANDIRREVYFKQNEGDPKIYMVKLQKPATSSMTTTHTLFRFSELLLIEAEAMERQGKGGLDLLNQFKKAKIPGYAGYTGGDVIGEIFNERRKEFILEEQHNWIDMKRRAEPVKRMGLDQATATPTEYSLDKNDYRYTMPIPEDVELMYNNIPQNPGWK